jgi:hypothetical protein
VTWPSVESSRPDLLRLHAYSLSLRAQKRFDAVGITEGRAVTVLTGPLSV